MATTKKKLTTAQKYNQLKRQTENAGMKVKEVDGKIVIIIIGDYWVAVKEDRPIDDSIIVLMKMSVTGLIGVIGGYIGGSKS
jgi:hypothetical protein